MFTFVLLIVGVTSTLGDDLNVVVSTYGSAAMRLRICHQSEGTHCIDDLPGGIKPSHTSTKSISSATAGGTLSYGNMVAHLKTDGSLLVSRTTDNATVLQLLDATASPPATNAQGYSSWSVHFAAWAEERLYGLGEHPQHHGVSFKGSFIDFKSEEANTHVTIPLCVSSRQVNTRCMPLLLTCVQTALFFNHPGFGSADFRAPTTTTWNASVARQLDFWFTTFDTDHVSAPYQSLLGQYYEAIGLPPSLPEWATSGLWASKQRYASQKEIVEVVQNYSDHGIVPSVLVIDWKHYNCAGDWGFTLNSSICWPTPSDMVEHLKSMGVKQVFVSLHPWSQPGSWSFDTMKAKGLCIADRSGAEVPWSGWALPTCKAIVNDATNCLYDPSNPSARSFLWNRLKQSYFDHGITNFWIDGTEPAGRPKDGWPENVAFFDANKTRSIPADSAWLMWQVWHSQTIHDGSTVAGSNDTWLLARSGFPGSHLNRVILWSGDISSEFSTLASMVTTGLNMQLTYPYWNTDTGGFSDGYTASMGELVVRWFQFSIFTSIVRLHGSRLPKMPNEIPLHESCDPTGSSGGPVEPWTYGPAASHALSGIKAALDLRLELLPYFREQLVALSSQGVPFSVPLWFHFPNDTQSLDIDDQFMFGPGYMVAPVVKSTNSSVPGHSTTRTVYFPSDTGTSIVFEDYFTGVNFTGGSRHDIELPTNLTYFPLFHVHRLEKAAQS